MKVFIYISFCYERLITEKSYNEYGGSSLPCTYMYYGIVKRGKQDKWRL